MVFQALHEIYLRITGKWNEAADPPQFIGSIIKMADLVTSNIMLYGLGTLEGEMGGAGLLGIPKVLLGPMFASHSVPDKGWRGIVFHRVTVVLFLRSFPPCLTAAPLEIVADNCIYLLKDPNIHRMDAIFAAFLIFTISGLVFDAASDRARKKPWALGSCCRFGDSKFLMVEWLAVPFEAIPMLIATIGYWQWIATEGADGNGGFACPLQTKASVGETSFGSYRDGGSGSRDSTQSGKEPLVLEELDLYVVPGDMTKCAVNSTTAADLCAASIKDQLAGAKSEVTASLVFTVVSLAYLIGKSECWPVLQHGAVSDHHYRQTHWRTNSSNVLLCCKPSTQRSTPKNVETAKDASERRMGSGQAVQASSVSALTRMGIPAPTSMGIPRQMKPSSRRFDISEIVCPATKIAAKAVTAAAAAAPDDDDWPLRLDRWLRRYNSDGPGLATALVVLFASSPLKRRRTQITRPVCAGCLLLATHIGQVYCTRLR